MWPSHSCCACPSAATEPTDEVGERLHDDTAFVFTLEDMDFSGLMADKGLFTALIANLEEAVGSDESIGIRPVEVELMGGQSVVHCIVILPHDITKAVLRERWRSSILASFTQIAAAKVSELDGIELISSQTGINVSHVSVPMASLLAPFQGHWMRKDTATYVIKGTRLRFESGGFTDIKVNSPNAISILHPSGLVLNACLECHGQQLRWTNGSLWIRVAAPGGSPSDAAQSPPKMAQSPSQATPGTASEMLSPATVKKSPELEGVRRRIRDSQTQLGIEQAQVREDQASLREKIALLHEQLEDLSRLREEVDSGHEGDELSLRGAQVQQQCCMWPIQENKPNALEQDCGLRKNSLPGDLVRNVQCVRHREAAGYVAQEDAMIGRSLRSIDKPESHSNWPPL